MNCHIVSDCSRAFARLTRTAASLVFALTAMAAVSVAATGRVSGTVTSKSTGNALQGALVSVPSLNRSALTDNTGRFDLTDMPEGDVSVAVSYAGFDDMSQQASVQGGATASMTFEMKASNLVIMEPFTVSTVKEGQALSITEQRNAANIKNVVAIDAWGNLPNVSIGELAMRLPGVSVPSGGGLDDDNVVMNVSIRGMDPNLTRLNIDGLPVTSVSGNGRTASLHAFTGALYEQVEVHDGATPDMSPNSIGGQLNLKTRSPLSMKEKRRFNYSVGLRWAPSFFYRTPEREQRSLHPSFNVGYREVFDVLGGHRNLGIAVNAFYSELVNMIDYRMFNYAAWGSTTPGAVNNFSTTTGLNRRHYASLNFRADYRHSESSKFSFNFIYNRGAEPSYDQTVSTVSGGTIAAGFTDTSSTLTGTTFSMANAHWSFYSKNPTVSFRGEHNWDRLALDYAARYSFMHFDSGTGARDEGGALSMRVTSVGATINRSNPDGVILTQNTGASIYDIASYTAGAAVPASNGVDNPTSGITFTRRSAKVDQPETVATISATYKVPAKFPFSIKGGLDYRNRVWDYRNKDARQWYHAATGTLPAVYVPLSAFDVQQGGNRLPEVDPRAVAAEVLTRSDLWIERPYYRTSVNYTSRRHAEEAISAGYLQGEVRFGKLGLLGGARYERTEVDNWSYVQKPTGLTTIAQEPDSQLRADRNFVRLVNKGSYDNLYPSIHGTYDITRNLKARASYSTSYAAAGFAALVPTLSISLPSATNPSGSLTTTNAALRPQYSKNYDFRLDYYTKESGVITAGAFKKKITDYLLTMETGVVATGNDNGFNGDYAGYRLFQTSNAGNVDVTGIQLSYQQQLTFLPGILKGTTLSANYTKINTEGDFGGINTSTQSALVHLKTGQVVGFTPESANFMVVHNYRGFTTRVVVNYTGEYISGYTAPSTTNPDTSANIYREALTTLNLGFAYQWKPGLSFSCDITNVTEAGPHFYRYTSDHLREIRRMPSTVSFGVNGRF